ncbi:hypothetical protein ACQKM9_11790 [Viridibacillus sp. NPDC093762]
MTLNKWLRNGYMNYKELIVAISKSPINVRMVGGFFISNAAVSMFMA